MNDDNLFDFEHLQDQQRGITPDGVVTDYYPEYNWRDDPLSFRKQFYCGDLLNSANQYWNGQYPGMSYAKYNGHKQLGRMVGPAECQYWLRQAEWRMQNLYFKAIVFIILIAGLGLAGGEGLLGGFGGGIITAICWTLPLGVFLSKRHYYRKLYEVWLETQGRVLQNGQPVWMPYVGKELANARKCKEGEYVWP